MFILTETILGKYKKQLTKTKLHLLFSAKCKVLKHYKKKIVASFTNKICARKCMLREVCEHLSSFDGHNFFGRCNCIYTTDYLWFILTCILCFKTFWFPFRTLHEPIYLPQELSGKSGIVHSEEQKLKV